MNTYNQEDSVHDFLVKFVTFPVEVTVEMEKADLKTQFFLFLGSRIKLVNCLFANSDEEHQHLTEEQRTELTFEILNGLSNIFVPETYGEFFKLLDKPFELGKETKQLFTKYKITNKESIPNILTETIVDNIVTSDYLVLSILYLANKNVEIEDGFNLVACH